MDGDLQSSTGAILPNSSLGKVFEEAVQRLQAGSPADLEKLIAEYPQFQQELLELLPTAEILLQLARSEAAAAESAYPDLAAGKQTIGDFRLVRELGRGGMGVVYEAEQVSLRRRVAMKILPLASMLDRIHLSRFQNEAYAAANLNHPHIVPVFAVGCDHGVHYYAMQLIGGCSLAQAIAELTSLPSAEANRTPQREEAVDAESGSSLPRYGTHDYWKAIARLGADVADALDYAHAQGILHRDVKPANLLIDDHGEIWVADFGLALLSQDARLTTTGALVGTLRYMSPEQALGKQGFLDHRADVYSLGATLYELLALRPVYGEGDRAELLRKIALEEPRPLHLVNRRIPSDLSTIVGTALEKDPAARYATARELADDLRRFLAQQPIKAKPASALDRLQRLSRRHRRVMTGVGLALLFLACVLIISNVQIRRARNEAVAALAETSELLYVSDVKLAYEAFERGRDDEARAILDRYRPQPGGVDRRGIEWRLLDGRLQVPALVELEGRCGAVNELAVAPDRQTLASVGEDGSLQLWHLPDRARERRVELSDEPLYAVAYSPDGRYLAAGGKDSQVYLLDIDNNLAARVLCTGTTGVESLAFSADGERIAAGFRYGEICLLTRSGELINRIARNGRCLSTEFVAGADLLLTVDQSTTTEGGAVNYAELWREDLSASVGRIYAASGEEVGAITCARPSPCGRFILAADNERQQLLILHRASRRILHRFPVSRSLISDVAYDPTGTLVAASYLDGTASAWRISVNGDDVYANGRGSQVRMHQRDVFCVRFVDADTLATAGGDGYIRLWNVIGAHVQPDWPRGLTATAITPSEDGRFLACTCRPRYGSALSEPPETLVVLDGVTGAKRCVISLPAGEKSVHWTAGDRFSVCAKADDASPSLYDPTGRLLWRGPWRPDMKVIACSDDMSHIAVAGKEEVSLYRADDPRPIYRRRLPYIATTLLFSHDGRRLAVGGSSPRIALIDVENHRLITELDGDHTTTGMTFSSDDRLLASGHDDGFARVWEIQAGRLIAKLSGHSGYLFRLRFSPDVKTLLTAARDGAIRVWSIKHQKCWGVLHEGALTRTTLPSFGLSRDGRRLTLFDCDEQHRPYWRHFNVGYPSDPEITRQQPARTILEATTRL